MLIGVISNIHDNGRPVLRAIEVFKKWQGELVLHCGDWDKPLTLQWDSELRCLIKDVLGNGNADIQKFWKNYDKLNLALNLELDAHFLDLKLSGQRIGVRHGDSESLLNFLNESQMLDVLCYGHNCQSSIQTKGKTLLITPGTLVGVNLPQTKMHPNTIPIYNTGTRRLIEL